jgi:hypothetical protein
VIVLNPALAEMVAKDRITELQGAAAKRSLRARASVCAETAAPQTSSRSIRHAQLANRQRAIGWFLVSVGLRLALPRTRTDSAR